MGFFSSAVFYRPDTPPIVSAKDVGRFLQELRQLDFAPQTKLHSAEINWGERISEDVQPFYIEEDISSTTHRKPWWKRLLSRQPSIEVTTTISQTKDLEPNFTCDTDFDELISQLMTTEQTVGRLYISGSLSADQYKWFRAPHPSGEQINFRPDTWALEFGEIKLGVLNGWDLENGECISQLQIGMMSFELAGEGYFFPWEFKEWVEKFTNAPGLQEVCELCRKTWPIESVPPSDELVMLRRECEDLWPYTDVNAPLDWAWGPRET